MSSVKAEFINVNWAGTKSWRFTKITTYTCNESGIAHIPQVMWYSARTEGPNIVRTDAYPKVL